MSPLLRTAGRRYAGRHPWLAGLSVLGVALGVSVVVAVDLANASAERAFELSTEAVTGRATHRVVGGPGGLDEELFQRLVFDAGVEAAAPVVEGYLTFRGSDGSPPRALHLLGVDPLSERPFRRYLAVDPADPVDPGGAGERLLAALLTEPGAALLSSGTAERLGIATGATLPLRTPGGPATVNLVGLLDPREAASRRALADLLVADISTAQELLGETGRLSRIDLRLPPGASGRDLLARVRRLLPPGAEVVPSGSRSAASREMTRAFRLNLQALSLLALLCGVFLIYNTMTFSVVQRRTFLGTLRALGVTRRQLFSLLLREAALVGLAGSGLGLLVGVLLGRGLVRLVTRTVNDLYFVVSVTDLSLPPAVLAKGFALGMAATLLAALAPAFEATSAPPRAVLSRAELESRTHRALPRVTLAGLGLLAVGALLFTPAVTGSRLLPAFTGVLAVLLGCACLTPGATVLLMRAAQPPLASWFGAVGRLAARGVVASLSRTGVAVAALMVAVAVTVGVGTMIGSFRQAVEGWLGRTLQADLYVSPPDVSRLFDAAGFPPALVRRFRALPGVARVSSVRRVELGAVHPGEPPVRLAVLDIDARSYRGFHFEHGDPRRAWPAFQHDGAVLVSQPFAYKRGVAVGDEIELRTDHGIRSFPVVGIHTDYASDQGVVLLSRSTYERFWDDRRISALSLYLAPGADPEGVADALRRSAGAAGAAGAPGAAGAGQPLVIQSNKALRQASLAVFDRTFLITDVLRLLAGAVAFVGVLSALMALQLERSRELGLLRAAGMTSRQVGRLLTAQTGLLGLVAGVLSLPAGLALAAIMVFVINRRSFGWTMELHLEPAVLAEAVLLALAAALLAGLYPAWKMARTSPAAALREE